MHTCNHMPLHIPSLGSSSSEIAARTDVPLAWVSSGSSAPLPIGTAWRPGGSLSTDLPFLDGASQSANVFSPGPRTPDFQSQEGVVTFENLAPRPETNVVAMSFLLLARQPRFVNIENVILANTGLSWRHVLPATASSLCAE